jgi:hypothetical protein
MEPTQILVGGGVAKLNKLSRIHLHGGCKAPQFVLAFEYAQTSRPHRFRAIDEIGLVSIHA